MSGENIFKILEKHNLGTFMDFDLYKTYSKETDDEKEIISKILEYKNYISNQNAKRYPESIMKYLRQRIGLEEYDFSKDDELNKMSPNDVFANVVEWNGLIGGYADTIKQWVYHIYGIDLDEIK